MYQCAFAIAVYALLRVSEFTCPRTAEFDPSRQVNLQDLQVFPNLEYPQYATLLIRTSKLTHSAIRMKSLSMQLANPTAQSESSHTISRPNYIERAPPRFSSSPTALFSRVVQCARRCANPCGAWVSMIGHTPHTLSGLGAPYPWLRLAFRPMSWPFLDGGRATRTCCTSS